MVKQLTEANAIDSIHDITVGYPAGLIRDENDLIDGKMPKEGFLYNLDQIFNDFSPFLYHASSSRHSANFGPGSNVHLAQRKMAAERRKTKTILHCRSKIQRHPPAVLG